MSFKLPLAATSALFLVITTGLAISAHYPASKLAPYVFFCVLMLLASVLIGFAIGHIRDKLVENLSQQSELPRAAKPFGQGGFTLMEILVVIAILSILAAFTASYVSSAKKSARVTSEESQIRNIYIAVGLYEADHNEVSPLSLTDLPSSYIPVNELANPSDARRSLSLTTWPANPGIGWSVVNDTFLSKMRATYMNSYYYLRTEEVSFPKGRTYQELRNDPELGFISGLGLFDCVTPVNGDGQCHYQRNPSPYNYGQPAPNLGGTMVEARTDGSLTTRHRTGTCDRGMTFAEQYLFQDFNCPLR